MRGTIRNITLIVVLLTIALVNPGLNTSSPVAGLPLGPAVVEAQDPPSPAPVWGIADTHQHQFANLGFGGFMIWGDVFNTEVNPETNLAKAVPWSDFVPGRYGDVVNFAGDSREPDVSASSLAYPNVPANCPPGTGSPSNPCQGFSIHGSAGTRDLINSALSGSLLHDVSGYPQFRGYPSWNMYTGQQMYYKWLERAWREGGLRLTVMFAVNNEALCKAIDRKAGYTCDDMPAIDRQIQAAKDLERFIDQQSGGPGQGWYRIAYSPQQARQIINEGKLAVVLGIETPSLFGCKVESDCTDEYVLTELKRYRDMGVRHIYPLHNADNGFGGTGLYHNLFALNTRVINGQWFDYADSCHPWIDFHLDLLDELQPGGEGSLPEPIRALVMALLGAVGGIDDIPPRPPEGANCNPRRLTDLGATLVRGMMDLGMIIDVDHLSMLTRDDVLDIAEQRQYAGVISSHNAFLELGIPRGDAESMRHEANMLPDQIERIRMLGGNVGVIIAQPDRATMREYVRSDGTVPVPYTCGGSSEAWAQAYLYAVDHMLGAPVALSTDHNGLAGMPRPRFGLWACSGDQSQAPANPVVYSTDPSQGLTKMKVGERYYDYNYDGFANIGMLPDFIQDVRNIGLSEADLAPLFSSAEGYIRMWERVDPGLPDPPNNAPSAHAGGPYLALAGTSITLQGRATDPEGNPISFSWDLDGNGVFETSGQTITFAASGPNRDVPIVMRACDSHAAGTQAACNTSRTFVHVRTPGRLYAWGGNAFGQLGVSSSSLWTCQTGTRCSLTPIAVPGLMDVVDVAAGKEHSLALKSDGTVWAWGGARGSTPVQVDGLSNVVAIAAGTDHSLALKSDGSVWAWGLNTFGQLGTGDTDSRSVPVPVPVIGPVTAISAGDRFSLALQDIGSIVGWGSNYNYQLGDQCWLGDDPSLPPTQCLSPVVVTGFGGPNIVGIAAGSTWSHALDKDGAVWVLGGADYETRQARRTPARVGGLTRSIAISAGTHDHVLAVRDSGVVRGYGRNEWGQVSDDCDDGYGFCWPYSVSKGWLQPPQWIAIAAGYGHSLALTDQGWVESWGTNFNGQLGRSEAAPGDRIWTLAGVIGIAAGYDHNLAIVPTTVSHKYRPDLFGNILRIPGYCAGHPDQCSVIDLPRNLASEPITFTYTYQPAPSAEAAGALGMLRLAGASFTLAARDASGNPVTSFPIPFTIRLRYQEQDWWGTEIGDEETLDIYRWDAATTQWQTFQLGWHFSETNDAGIRLDHLEPVSEFALLGERANQLPVGHPGGPYQALAGTTIPLYATGSDPDGDTISFEWDLDGDGVYEAPGQDVSFVASGPSRDVAVALRTCDARGACSTSRSFVYVRVPGRAVAWGLNDSGQLGASPAAVGLCGAYPCSPTALPVPGLQGVVDVAAGGRKSLALTSDGRVWEWGSSTGSTPTQVPGFDRTVDIAAGYDHVLALKDDGSVWAWGRNNYGQLGIGDLGDQTLPVRVPGIGPAAAIAAGNQYSLVMLDDGSIWGWGDNRWYQLGDQCYDPNYGYHFPQKCWSPVLVPDLGGRDTVGISAGTTWSVAWDNSGVVWLQGGWDPNRNLEPRLTPERMDVLADSLFVSSSIGDHILSRRVDGTVWGYGENSRGRLGSGCTTLRCFTPVQVQDLPMSPSVVLAADTSSFALDDDGNVWGWGDNWAGQLGDGGYGGSTSLPVPAVDVTGVTILASGGWHVLAIVPAGPTPPPGTVSVTAQPGEATSVALPHERGTLDLPAGVATVPTTFTYTELAGPSEAPPPGLLQFAGLSFTLEARDAAGNPVTTFPAPFTLVLSYQDADWQGAGIPAERLLNLFWWDTATARWRGVLPCDGCALDTVNNSLTVLLGHLTEFALLGWTDTFPPVIRADADPAANAAGWNGSDTTVTLRVTDTGGSGVHSLTYSATGAQSLAGTTLNGDRATIVINAEGQTTLTYAARDNAGNVSDSGTLTIQLDKTAPTITIITPAPFDVLPVGTVLDFGADDAVSGIQSVSAVLTNDSESLPVSSGNTLSQAGVYSIIVQATDMAGHPASETRSFVVYDPNGGFVTGGGWIDSPANAYVPDPALVGKATFGFVSKYQKGATAPSGKTQFQFKVADLDFHSNSYEWLVVNQAGTNAQFKGSGTINDAGSYKFMLWAGDGAPDSFRIKIWEELDGEETVIYDNGVAQPIGGGSIVVHKN